LSSHPLPQAGEGYQPKRDPIQFNRITPGSPAF
jgi:hypothetical protein